MSDFLSMTRCFRCQLYGHIAVHCKVDKEVRRHCGEDCHKQVVCPSKSNDLVCVNCKLQNFDYKHSHNEKGCQSYRRAMEAVFEETTMASNLCTLRVGQTNLQRSARAADFMRRSSEEMQLDVLLIQEPYIVGAQVRRYPVRARKITDLGGSVCSSVVVLREDLDVTVLRQHCSSHVIAAEICFGGNSIILVSIYCQFSGPLENYIASMEDIIRSHRGKDHPCYGQQFKVTILG